ncbi:MAG: SH3 domain-containing protein [Acidiferrobacterales bacterium]
MAALGRLTGRAIGWSLLAALLIVGALLWYLFSNDDLSERKIIYVTGSVVNVREGPSTGFSVVTKLKKGHKLVELSREGDWVNIALEETIAKTAWIHASLVSAEPQAEKSP